MEKASKTLQVWTKLTTRQEKFEKLCAESAFLAPEVCVESRCQRCFCLRQLLLIPLIHCFEVRSQFERPIRLLHRISVEPVWLSDVFDMLCTCCATLSLSCASIVIAVSCSCRRTFSCGMATAMCSCSSRVDMVVHARGAVLGRRLLAPAQRRNKD